MFTHNLKVEPRYVFRFPPMINPAMATPPMTKIRMGSMQIIGRPLLDIRGLDSFANEHGLALAAFEYVDLSLLIGLLGISKVIKGTSPCAY